MVCNVSMDNNIIAQLYTEDRWTLRMIADKFNTNHHLIKRRLVSMGIKITRRNTLREFTDEHKQKISDSRKKLMESGWIPYNRGLKVADMPNGRGMLLGNMRTHLRYDVSLEWLNSFQDIEKLKFLNRTLTRQRDCEGFTTEMYMMFIEKFYNDKKFNDLYDKWKETGNKWIKPSLDHIQAKANGGTLFLDNLQFISWLENRAKVDIDQSEWEIIKKDINYYL